MSVTGGPSLRTAVTRAGSTVVVTLSGELDLATADRLRSRLTTVVLADPALQVLVLDAAGLQFVDAAGISVLLEAQRTLAGRGGRVALRSPSPLLLRVVRALDLQNLLPLES